MAVSARLEVRVHPDSKARMERAAALTHVPLSEFVRCAAEDRANRILREHEKITRVVPAAYVEEVEAALDEPVIKSAALLRAAKRSAAALGTD